MNFYVMTLFPEMIINGLNTSITGRAIEKGLIKLEAVNIRDYTHDKHNHVDDYPYGGGAGMVMQAQPVYDCYINIIKRINESALQGIADDSNVTGGGMTRKPRVIFLTPTGKTFNQQMAREFAAEENLVFLCGHYEGIDQRVLDMTVTDNVSIGDYVLTGGELPAMVMIDAISRFVKGVLNNDISAETESFTDNLLEYPQYTRPEEFMGVKVPGVLLSGRHANIERWRRNQSLIRTYENRPDMFERVELDKKDRKFLMENNIKYRKD